MLAAPPTPLGIFYQQENFTGLDEEIFPLGWAKEGSRLAILAARPNEASDDRTWAVQVIDLVSDKRILDEDIIYPDKGGITEFWAANGEKVMGLLKPHGIVPANFSVHPFPALLGRIRGDSYEISLTRSYKKEPNFQYRGLSELQATLLNKEGESKQVYKYSWKEWFPLAAGVVGYLPNPQGDRIAILIAVTHRGYESAPHIRELIIVGAGVGEHF